MNRIELRGVIPEVFYLEGEQYSDTAKSSASDIWGTLCSFNRKESYLVRAESGRGKSSMCNFILGSRRDYHGEILFDGAQTNRFGDAQWQEIRRERISYLPQGLMLFDELTAWENIDLKNQLTNGYKSREWIMEALDFLELSDRVDYEARWLSYGQRQRVALIRALCQPFDFLLLDEPISHLDNRTARLAAELIQRELETNNSALIATSIGKELPINYSRILTI